MISAPSQCIKIHCAYCTTECLLKNHKRYLKEKHPEVNPEGEKDNKTQTITTFYSKKRKKVCKHGHFW